MPADAADNKVHDGCSACHAADGSMAVNATAGAGDCTKCHNAYFDSHAYGNGHLNTAQRGTDLSAGAACNSCHQNNSDGAGIALDSWTDIRNLHDVATNGAGACATCHQSARQEVKDAITLGVGGGQIGCLTCHSGKASAHADHVTMGVITGLASCNVCHDPGSVGTSSFYTDTLHAGGCATCHTDPANSDYSLKAGSSAAGHGRLEAGFGNPNTCGTCHSGIAADWYAHDVDHGAKGFVSLSADCQGCHGVSLSYPGFVDGADNKKHDSCAVCHNADGSLVNVAAAGGAECTTCHGAYFANHSNINHSTTVAQAANCALCHTGTEGTLATVPTSAADNKVHDGCAACHNANGTLVAGAVAGAGDCTKCHGQYFASHGNIDHSGTVAAAADCAGCHAATAGTLTTVPVDAANNRVHDSCSACHAADGSLAAGATGGLGDCTKCHGAYFANHSNINHSATVAQAANCALCHTGTAGTLATVPTSAADNKVHDGCATCHNANGTLVAGATAGAGDCTKCHGQYFTSHTNANHSATVAQAANCALCHTGTAGTATTVPTSAADNKVHDACGACHNADGSLTAGATAGAGDCTKCHGQYFASHTSIDHRATVAGAAECTTCHAATAGTATTVPADAADNKVHDGCSACHAADGSMAVNAVSGAGDCTKCHNAYFDSHAYGNGHLNTALRATDLSAGVSCNVCHGTDSDISGTRLDSWAEVRNLHDVVTNGAGACATCHQSARQEVKDAITLGVGGGQVGCLDCHSSWGATMHADHVTMGVVTGLASCNVCHDPTSVGTSSFYTETLHAGCTTCHTDPNNSDYSLKAGSSAEGHGRLDAGFGNPNTCGTCHSGIAADWYAHDVDHGAKGFVSLSADCQGCHGVSLSYPGFVDGADNKKHDSCAVCHNADGSLVNVAAAGGAECTTCHGAYFANHSNINHSTTVAQAANCALCHTGTEGTLATVPTSAADNKVHDGCAACHNANGTLVAGAVAGAGDCTKCHGQYFASHGNIDHSGTVAAAADCAGCHAATAGTLTTVPVDAANNRVHDSCSACHAADGSLAAGATGGLGDCTKCHGAYFANHSNINHSATVAQAANCALCHTGTAGTLATVPTSAADNKVHDGCATCHNANGTLVAGATAGAGDCTKCHGQYFTSHTNANHSATVAQAANCALCHTGTAGTATTVPTSAADNKVHDACGACHNADGSLTAGATAGAGDCTKCHGQYFASHTSIDHRATVAGAAECTTCHAATAGTATTVPADAADNKVHDGCSACHAADGSMAVNAVSGAGDCTKCHNAYFDSHAYGNGHLNTAQRGTDLSAGAACNSCHQNNSDGAGIALDSWTDIRNLHDVATNGAGACATCHQSARQAVKDAVTLGVGGGQIGCLTCHSGKASAHADHVTMGVITGLASCNVCHDPGSVGTSSFYTDTLHAGGCATCHTDPANSDYSLKAGSSAAGHGRLEAGFGNPNTCGTCHSGIAADWYAHDVDHGAKGFVSLSADCQGCHGVSLSYPGFVDGADNKKHDSCAVCHNADGSLVNVAAAGGAECTTCHGAYFASHSNINHSTTVALAANCALCHTGTEGTLTTVPTSAADNKVHDGCATCHAANGNLLAGVIPGVGDCTKCHGQYFASHTNANHSTTVALAANCALCHTGTAGTATTVPTSAADNKVHDGCAACHNADGTLVAGATAGAGDCTKCHGQYFASHTNANHTLRVADTANCNSCHTATAGTATTVPTSAADNRVHDACTSCHNADGSLRAMTAPGGSAAIAAGDCNGCHGAYFASHTNANHTATVAMATNCALCHTGTAGTATTVPTSTVNNKVHDACSSCHNVTNGAMTAGATAGAGDCTKCHGQYFASHSNANHSTRVAGLAECTTCHTATAGTATTVPVNGADDKVHDACATCHNADGSLRPVTASGGSQPIAAGNCNGCHGSYFPSHTHHSGVNNELSYDPAGGDTSQTTPTGCASCHNDNGGSLATFNDIYVEHFSDCARCHSYTGNKSAPLAAVQSAIATAGAKHCRDCHTDKVPNVGHGGHDPGHFAWDVTSQATCGTALCHDYATNGDVVANIHHNTCTLCHSSSSGGDGTAKLGDRGLGDARLASTAAPHADNCLVCHGSGYMTTVTGTHTTYGGKHHTNVHAQGGDCDWCHADSRPGWASQYGVSAPNPMPKQLACIKCHIEPAGTGLVVYRNTYTPVNVSTSYPNGTSNWGVNNDAAVQKSAIHTITGGAKINIYNYGICLGCHQDVNKVGSNARLQVWHAKPTWGKTQDTSAAGNETFDVLRNAPGRSYFANNNTPPRATSDSAANDRRFNIFATGLNTGGVEKMRMYGRYTVGSDSTKPYKGTSSQTRGKDLYKDYQSTSQNPWIGSVYNQRITIPQIDAVNDPANLMNSSPQVPYYNDIPVPGPF
ncbi:MAG: cytochrome c3 family protein [Thermodesulfobacteriota bacterium]